MTGVYGPLQKRWMFELLTEHLFLTMSGVADRVSANLRVCRRGIRRSIFKTIKVDCRIIAATNLSES